MDIGSLIAAAIAAWVHQLTGTILGADLVAGHGTRDGKAMIATLRRKLIAIPARLVRHGGNLILRPPLGAPLLAGILATIRDCPHQAEPAPAARPAPPAPHRHPDRNAGPTGPAPQESHHTASPARRPGQRHAPPRPAASRSFPEAVENLATR